MHHQGPKVLIDIPDEKLNFDKQLSVHDLALIDEFSGLTGFVDNYLHSHNMPEATKERIRARVMHYNGPEDKTVAMNRMRIAMYGTSR